MSASPPMGKPVYTAYFYQGYTGEKPVMRRFSSRAAVKRAFREFASATGRDQPRVIESSDGMGGTTREVTDCAGAAVYVAGGPDALGYPAYTLDFTERGTITENPA